RRSRIRPRADSCCAASNGEQPDRSHQQEFAHLCSQTAALSLGNSVTSRSPLPIRTPLLVLAAILLAACTGQAGVAPQGSPSATRAGGMSQGLIAYAATAGIGVLDPATGKSTMVAPLPAGGAFRVAGPVWGPAPGLTHPVL